MAIDNPHAIDESREKRRKDGKLLRHQIPRSSHANWTPAPDRIDALTLLQEQDNGRIQHLLPIKYGRMLASPFAFLRGSAIVMAADLANSPVTGLTTMLCGDAHLSNFGLFATPERKIVFDINEDNLNQIFEGSELTQLEDSSVKNTWQQYLASLPVEKRFLLSRFRPTDAALRVGGVGSVGTRCLIVLLEGGADGDALILQLKEAGPSVLEKYVPNRTNISPAKRVVLGQKMMQTTTDIFLGWHQSQIPDHDFYWRQLKDMKGSVDVTKMDKAGFNSYAEVCGLCLARAHARTGDAAGISGYLGTSDTFDQAMGDFALSYANQTERDYEIMLAAVDSGQIVAMPGI